MLARLADAWSDHASIDGPLDLVVEAVGADRGPLMLGFGGALQLTLPGAFVIHRAAE